MKKLLNLLSMSLLVSAISSLSISCTKTDDNVRITDSNLKLTDKILNQVNAQINNGDYKAFGTYTNKQIWSQNTDTINNLILSILNKNIAENQYVQIMENRYKNITGEEYSDSDKSLESYFEKYITDMTMNNLYQTYTKDIDTANYLENSIYKNNGEEPDVESSDWNIPGTYSYFFKGSNNNTGAWNDDFNWDDPNNSSLITDTRQKASDTFNTDKWTTDLSQPSNIEKAKDDLAVRFRTYIHNDLEPQMFKTALINEYLQLGNFSYSDNKPLINEFSSPLLNSWQNWSSTSWNSNMKMVWEIRFTKPKNGTSYLTSDPGFLQFEKTLQTVTTLGDFNKAINDFTDAKNYGFEYGGTNNIGSDSIFANPGYEGLYGITTQNNDPTTAGTIFTSNSSNSDITPYTSQLTTNSLTNSPGVISGGTDPNGGNKKYFIDSTNGNVVVAFCLPIYFLDLINGAQIYSINNPDSHGISYTPFDASDKDGKILNPVSYYNSNYNDNNKTNSNLQLQWKDMNTNSDPKTAGNNIASYDVENLDVNQSEELFTLIQSAIATNGMSSDGSSADTNIALNAEQALYSWAFDYYADNIYSDSLYKEIGKYVQSYD